MPALILLDALDALANARQDTVGQIVEQRPLPGREDGSLEDHVVEGDAVENLGASRRQLLGERRQPRLEQLEQGVRHELPRRGEPLAGRLSGQLQDLGGDTIEELRVTILVAALEKEQPHHHRVHVLGAVGERHEVLGDRVLGDAEAGEQRGQAPAALHRQLGPGARVGLEVDGRRVPLQPGDDLRVGREPGKHQQLGAVSEGNAEPAGAGGDVRVLRHQK